MSAATCGVVVDVAAAVPEDGRPHHGHGQRALARLLLRHHQLLALLQVSEALLRHHYHYHYDKKI